MAILVGQLIEILQRYDRDREVTIHTLKGETVEVNGYFVQRDLNDNAFYLTDLDVVPNFNGRMFLFSSVLHYHRQVLRN